MLFRHPQYLHPLVAAAAVSLTLASVVGIAKLTGFFEQVPPAEPAIVYGSSNTGQTASGAPRPPGVVNIATALEGTPAAAETVAGSGTRTEMEAGVIPSVYVHVQDEAARQRMIKLIPALEKNGIALAGIKLVSIAPARSDLRYFHADEKAEALTVQATLVSLGLPAQRLKRIDGTDPIAKRRQYELWLSDG